MNTNFALFETDLAILEAMVAELPAYLMSDATRWPLPQMPALTLGGILMRLQRLQLLQMDAPVPMQQRLAAVKAQYETHLTEKIVRFEARAHQELHARLGEWTACLRKLHCVGEQYAEKADTRVVTEALIDALQERPYQLETQIVDEVAALDRNLRSRWQPGAFIWNPFWEAAYPPHQYWWLYGQPTSVLEQTA